MALSDRAGELLKAVAQSEQGIIFVSRDATYQTVLIDNRDYVKEQTPEQIAEAKAAVKELEQIGYVDTSFAKCIFALTERGYEAAHHI
jgi:hypothetical protein